MNLKIVLFFQIFLLFFPFSSSNIKHNQQFIVETKNLINRNGIPYINFLKIELNKFDENIQQETLEIDIEISEEMKDKIIFILPRNSYGTLNYEDVDKIYYTNNVNFIDGKGQMEIKEKFIKEYLEGVIICELLLLISYHCKVGCLVVYIKVNNI